MTDFKAIQVSIIFCNKEVGLPLSGLPWRVEKYTLLFTDVKAAVGRLCVLRSLQYWEVIGGSQSMISHFIPEWRLGGERIGG